MLSEHARLLGRSEYILGNFFVRFLEELRVRKTGNNQIFGKLEFD